jgi:hypothetical protein
MRYSLDEDPILWAGAWQRPVSVSIPDGRFANNSQEKPFAAWV